MRVILDRDLCESNGVCEGLAPEVFRINDDDELDKREPRAVNARRWRPRRGWCVRLSGLIGNRHARRWGGYRIPARPL